VLKRGVKNVKMLHTHDPKVADTESVRQGLRDATAVWFDGGRQWNIVDSYANTLTYREFHKVLERGGVIGGSSAGATIQGDYLVRGDTSGTAVVMTEEPTTRQRSTSCASRRSTSTSTPATAGSACARHQEVSRPPRHRSLRRHRDHRQGRSVRSDGQVEGRDPRQHAHVPAVGKSVLRAVAGDVYDMKARKVVKFSIGAPRRPAWVAAATSNSQRTTNK
jgi:hypothetical protein